MNKIKILTLNLILAFVICILIYPAYGTDPTTQVQIVKYASDGTTILNEISITYQTMESDLPVCGDGVTHYYHQGPVFGSPPGPWDESETMNFKDKGALKGTDVKDLCELVGGMLPGEEIDICAFDGLCRKFAYSNVYEPQSRQGPMVICWYKNGNYIADFEEGMQLVFFADNLINPENKHVFGNWDMHECFAPEYRYNHSSDYPSSNGLSIKWIDKIAIYSNEDVSWKEEWFGIGSAGGTAITTTELQDAIHRWLDDLPVRGHTLSTSDLQEVIAAWLTEPGSENEWDLTLDGAIIDIMDRPAFESCSGCHTLSWTDESNREWSGMPLWILAGAVDDTDTHGSTAFNDTLANEGYDITITAGDGYSKIFNSADMARNESYIVACYLNGSVLPELTEKGKPLAPLKLVGPLLSSGQQISNIANISLDISPAQQEADLTLIGNEIKKYTLDEVKAMPSYTASGGFKKSTGVIVGPYMYTGINITYLIDLVGGITPSNSVKVTASDGYSMIYSYDQVMGQIATYNITTGEPESFGDMTMVMAYEEDGVPVSDELGGPIRIAFTGPGSLITDGHFWIKYVKKIEILDAVDEWNFILNGSITDIVDRSTFESCAGCHARSWTDENDQEWRGIPLWLLVGVVDDDVSSESKHYFNDSVADEGYNVTVIADDGYNKIFNSSLVKRNDNILVVNEINGTVLPGEYYPLRLTGPVLKKSQMVGNIVEMRLDELIPNED